MEKAFKDILSKHFIFHVLFFYSDFLNSLQKPNIMSGFHPNSTRSSHHRPTFPFPRHRPKNTSKKARQKPTQRHM